VDDEEQVSSNERAKEIKQTQGNPPRHQPQPFQGSRRRGLLERVAARPEKGKEKET
jgi:hypothetical protein